MFTDVNNSCISTVNGIVVGSTFYELPLRTVRNGNGAQVICNALNGTISDFQNKNSRKLFHFNFYSHIRKGI